MTLTASIILILLALRSFCIFRLERFEFALFQKHMVIVAFEFHKNNPELCQGLMERDPDKLLKSQLIVAKKLEQNFEEFQKQQQRQMKSKEKSQGKPLKVSFKKNSKANKISRSEKRIRTIVGIIDEWNKTAITSINQNILLLYSLHQSCTFSENKIRILIQSEYYKGGLQCRMNSTKKATNEMCWRRFKYVVDGSGQPGPLTWRCHQHYDVNNIMVATCSLC